MKLHELPVISVFKHILFLTIKQNTVKQYSHTPMACQQSVLVQVVKYVTQVVKQLSWKDSL